MDNLWAQEIDADQHIKQYQGEIRQKILDMYGFDSVPDEIEHTSRQLRQSPPWRRALSSTPLSISSLKAATIIYLRPGAAGHALYYLSMAKVYDEWINKITKLREEMREYEEMVSRLKREKETEEDQI